jgi:hypothetical protein
MRKFWWITFLSLTYWVHENIYFGWNMFPKSDAELIADGLIVFIFALAITTLKESE